MRDQQYTNDNDTAAWADEQQQYYQNDSTANPVYDQQYANDDATGAWTDEQQQYYQDEGSFDPAYGAQAAMDDSCYEQQPAGYGDYDLGAESTHNPVLEQQMQQQQLQQQLPKVPQQQLQKMPQQQQERAPTAPAALAAKNSSPAVVPRARLAPSKNYDRYDDVPGRVPQKPIPPANFGVLGSFAKPPATFNPLGSKKLKGKK